MAKSLFEFFERDGNFFEAYVFQNVKFIEAEAEGVYVGNYAKQSKVHIQI